MGLKLYFIVVALFLYLPSISSDTLVYKPVYKDLVSFVNTVEKETTTEDLLMNDTRLRQWWTDMLSFDHSDPVKDKYLQINKQSALSRALSFKAYYNENFETGIGDDEDISYKRRMFAGLELELLKDGLLTAGINKSNNKSRENIDAIRYKEKTLDYKYMLWGDYVDKYFDVQIKSALYLKLKLITKLYDTYRLLSYDFKVSRTAVMEKKSEMNEIKKKLKSLANTEGFTVPGSLPFLNISIDSILEYKTDNAEKELLKNKLNLLRNKRKMISQWSLRPNLRYNFLDRDGGSNAKYGSAGFFLTIPFNSLSKNKKLENLEAKLLEQESKRNIELKNIGFVNIVKRSLQIEEDLEIKINQYNIIQRKLESMKNRRIIYPESFNVIDYLELLTEKSSCELDLLELNKKSYLNILKLSKDARGINPDRFTSTVSYHDSFKCFSGERYIYIWSDFINKVDPRILLAYLKEYEIGSVMISLGNKKVEEYNKYIEVLTKEGINVYALLGSNKIINADEKQVKSILNKLSSLNVKGVNLDIEPHTLPDWDSKKSYYYARMLKIYSYANTILKSKNKQLHASIPVYYEQSFCNKLNTYVDKVFLMAYQSNKAEKIVARVQQELNVFGKQKTIIAYRPKDFMSAVERENLINKVIEKTACTGVAFHKASDLFKTEIIKK